MTSISMTTKPLRPTLWIEQGQVFTWDQTRLPFEREVICLANSQDCARAIASMQVRGTLNLRSRCPGHGDGHSRGARKTSWVLSRGGLA